MYVIPEMRLNLPNCTPPARGRDLFNLYGARYAPSDKVDYTSHDPDDMPDPRDVPNFGTDSGQIYEDTVVAQRDGIRKALSGYEHEHGIKPGEISKLVDEVLGRH